MTVVDLNAHLKNGGQVMKTRNDHAPVFLIRPTGSMAGTQVTLPDDLQ